MCFVFFMIFLIFSLAYVIVRMRYIEHVMRKKGKSYMQTFSCVEGSRLPHPPVLFKGPVC